MPESGSKDQIVTTSVLSSTSRDRIASLVGVEYLVLWGASSDARVLGVAGERVRNAVVVVRVGLLRVRGSGALETVLDRRDLHPVDGGERVDGPLAQRTSRWSSRNEALIKCDQSLRLQVKHLLERNKVPKQS